MTVRYTKEFLAQLKKQNVRIRKSFKKAISQFSKNPSDKELNSHELHGKWQGYRSINITDDWRAIYEEVNKGEEIMAYFITLGTHRELYK